MSAAQFSPYMKRTDVCPGNAVLRSFTFSTSRAGPYLPSKYMRNTKPQGKWGCPVSDKGVWGRGLDTTVPNRLCACLGRDIREEGQALMAGPVKDREAFQRLSFLYQGPLGEEDALSWLLLSPHPGPHLHPAPETKGQRWTVQTCLTCQRSQRFLNDPKHLLWGDRPEAQLENQADFKPSEPLPNIAHLPKENAQPQASNTSDEFTPFSR
ncbi:ribonuclease P protein subunit p21 isoform X2 [Peromyscus californicus insignis]|uniref:ribonuclease P protein subunit p21 isoform X2 n=1 Tax=Peromyscus californicus insignis TaxID=564181 RepID=UPI0022A80014|nr:ribonuclease P protein subunit p21 isoform X2 [Peromyscus californicus insignis]